MTARGTVFLALEDETGMVNVTLWPDDLGATSGVVRRHALLLVDGELQREGKVVNVVAHEVRPLAEVAGTVGGPERPPASGRWPRRDAPPRLRRPVDQRRLGSASSGIVRPVRGAAAAASARGSGSTGEEAPVPRGGRGEEHAEHRRRQERVDDLVLQRGREMATGEGGTASLTAVAEAVDAGATQTRAGEADDVAGEPWRGSRGRPGLDTGVGVGVPTMGWPVTSDADDVRITALATTAETNPMIRPTR